jgi:sodium/pantothenate symporter
MSPTVFAIILCAAYALCTFWLSILGMRRTQSLKSFAIGSGDMSPVLVGITMSSSIASTATFVINPGFVYTDGLAAIAHYGLAGWAGSLVALLLLSRGFHRIGSQVQAYTVPDWLRKRYRSAGLGMLFAALTLLYVTFLVLILSGSANVLASLFQLDYHVSLVGLLLFVFGYVLMGGTYAHAYTNAMQGIIMAGVALLAFFSGVRHLGPGFLDRLASVSAHYAAWVNPESRLYHDVFAVFISSFVITFALMLQPHVLTKLLYIKRKEDLRIFLYVTLGTWAIFLLMLLVGVYARLSGLQVERQDLVVVTYLEQTFNPMVVSFLFVALLAAGMSTLDGILVSVSSIVVNDLVLGWGERTEARMRKGLAWSRYVLVGMGLLTLALAWNPPRLLGLFAQQGIYGLVAASTAPFVLGVLRPDFGDARVAGLLGLLGAGIHFGLNVLFQAEALAHLGWGITNPSVSAAWGILVSTSLGLLLTLRPSARPAPVADPAPSP